MAAPRRDSPNYRICTHKAVPLLATRLLSFYRARNICVALGNYACHLSVQHAASSFANSYAFCKTLLCLFLLCLLHDTSCSCKLPDSLTRPYGVALDGTHQSQICFSQVLHKISAAIQCTIARSCLRSVLHRQGSAVRQHATITRVAVRCCLHGHGSPYWVMLHIRCLPLRGKVPIKLSLMQWHLHGQSGAAQLVGEMSTSLLLCMHTRRRCCRGLQPRC